MGTFSSSRWRLPLTDWKGRGRSASPGCRGSASQPVVDGTARWRPGRVLNPRSKCAASVRRRSQQVSPGSSAVSSKARSRARRRPGRSPSAESACRRPVLHAGDVDRRSSAQRGAVNPDGHDGRASDVRSQGLCSRSACRNTIHSEPWCSMLDPPRRRPIFSCGSDADCTRGLDLRARPCSSLPAQASVMQAAAVRFFLVDGGAQDDLLRYASCRAQCSMCPEPVR